MARPKIVVIGAGFAGLHALRRLERRVPHGAAEIVLVAPDDYMLYSPLLPEVATGVIEARHIAVSLRSALPCTRLPTTTNSSLMRRRRDSISTPHQRRR